MRLAITFLSLCFLWSFCAEAKKSKARKEPRYGSEATFYYGERLPGHAAILLFEFRQCGFSSKLLDVKEFHSEAVAERSVGSGEPQPVKVVHIYARTTPYEDCRGGSWLQTKLVHEIKPDPKYFTHFYITMDAGVKLRDVSDKLDSPALVADPKTN